ncbi:putative sterigmatocystin biosynthesis P450 monooxygenase [Podospora australis]|uniref:Sterigmatocystin biosynthesis P450 monooxygenase n=1 Tax=Podospora australis TaxID=1536484 RepID=A0AAN7ADH8_9PEZI|nr:putative sterigmatocystin biosynthesis P450 monooxygenase [Podospora australis]
MTITSLLYVTAGLLACLLLKILATRSPLSHIPGPWYTKYTSLVSIYQRFRGTKMIWIHELHKKYGPVVRTEPTHSAFATAADWERIYRVNSGFIKTPFYERIRSGQNHMLFTMIDTKQHAARRKLFARSLTAETLRNNWEGEIRKIMEAGVQAIKKDALNGNADLPKWWKLTMSDVVTRLAFGQSFDMVETGGKGENSAYFRALVDVTILVVVSDVLPGIQTLAGLIPVKRVRQILNSGAIITKKGQIAVNNLRQDTSPGGKATLFSNMLALAAAVEEKGEERGDYQLSDDDIKSEAAGFIMAGLDSTAIAMAYLVWSVLRNRDIQQRLEAEVALLPDDFREKDLEGLTLLNNVIDETLRLYGPAAGPQMRLVPVGGFASHGHHIPAGCTVTTQQWTRVRDENLFHDAEKFIPDRFNSITPEQRRVAQPFGIGSRACIGIALVRMELRLGAAIFFRECRGAKISNGMTDDMMAQRIRFFTTPKGGKCEITLSDA